MTTTLTVVIPLTELNYQTTYEAYQTLMCVL